jgi:hypothetical protein
MSGKIVNAICRTFPGAEVYDPWSGRHDGSPGSRGSCTLHLILPFCSPRSASTADKIRLLSLRSIQNESRIADVEAWGSEWRVDALKIVLGLKVQGRMQNVTATLVVVVIRKG